MGNWGCILDIIVGSEFRITAHVALVGQLPSDVYSAVNERHSSKPLGRI